MPILVTGGTGFLGKRLVKKLLNDGEIIVFSRHEDGELKEAGAKFALGDIRNKDDLRRAFSRVDVVYHLAANLDESDPHMREDNITGTRNVVGLCKENRAKLIFMSSCGVLGDAGVALENAEYKPKTEYEKSKAEGENLVMNSGLCYIIVRAPVIIGPSEIWLKIFRAAKKKFPVIGSGRNHFHLAYVEDVAELLYRIKDDKRAENNILHIATEDAPTYEEVYAMMCGALGTEMTKRRVPLSVMLFISSLHALYCRLLGKKQSLTMMPSSIQRLTRDRTVSMENTKQIGFLPKYSTKQAVEETASYFISRNML